MSFRIFVALSAFAQQDEAPLKLLQESGYPFKINPLGKRLSQDELIELGRDYEGVIAGLEPYNDYVLEHMPKLRCISRCGVGIDNISLPTAQQKGIVVRNTPEVVIQPVAELTVAMIFDLLRNLTVHTQLLKNKKWEKRTGGLLQGKKVGILGLGKIGKKVAEILKILEADVYGTDLVADRPWAQSFGVKVVSLEELLKTCDILSIHLSAVDHRPFQLGQKQIAMMKKGAMVVNVARGVFIDDKALYDALKEGRLAGAALDVFSEEPYAGPLCELDNVVLTPHVATLTEESRGQMEFEATKNLIDFLSQSR